MTCQVQCPIHPAPTEIIDESDLLVEDDVISLLKAQGIEVRDFASLEERRKVAQNVATEIFDPYRAIAEFEHKLDISSKFRTSGSRRPISGKVIQCLLDIRWISEEEIERRCIPADIQALREYRKKLILDAREGWGIYPWRALRWDSVPMVQERRKFIVKYGLESVTESRNARTMQLVNRYGNLLSLLPSNIPHHYHPMTQPSTPKLQQSSTVDHSLMACQGVDPLLLLGLSGCIGGYLMK